MDVFMSVSVMFSRNIIIESRHESILFVYANNILIRIIKILHKSSFSTNSTKFYKTLSCKIFPQSTKFSFFMQLFLLINTTFIQSKYCLGEILWILLHSWRNIIPCREMWLFRTLYNMVKDTSFLNTDISILWNFQ